MARPACRTKHAAGHFAFGMVVQECSSAAPPSLRALHSRTAARTFCTAGPSLGIWMAGPTPGKFPHPRGVELGWLEAFDGENR
jgi:hypothetical protein